MTFRTRLIRLITALAMTFAVVVAVAGVPASALDPVTPRVDLKILVVSKSTTAPSYEAWIDLLKREGVPYDVFDTSSDTLEYSDLALDDHAFYQAIICATRCSEELGIGSPSAIAVETFLSDFGLRRINAYAYPASDLGLAPGSAGQVGGDTLSLTVAGSVAFPYLDGEIPIGDFTYGYYGSVIDPEAFETYATGPGGAPVLGVFENPAGFDEMVMTIDGNQYQTQTLLLGHGMLSWVTDGVFLGYSRNYFSAHIDDVFLPDDRWDIEDNTTYEDLGATNPLIRMDASDVDRMMTWMADTGVRLDMVFNAEGSVEAIEANDPDPLTDALLAVKDQLYWINHTYSHLSLNPPVSTATIESEILDNLTWAGANGIPTDATELVTGEHSGLGNSFYSIEPNPNLPTALSSTGIEWVAADNSVQPDPYTVGSATTIPRYPANVYYNAATQDEQLDEYTWLYVSDEVVGADGGCDPDDPPPLTTCLDHAVTWDQYVGLEASIMLPHLIRNDPRPHYFHQANLAEDGVFYSVFGEVLNRYEDFFEVPLVQPRFSEAGEIMTRKARWDAVKDDVVAFLQGGSVHLSSSTSIEVPLTGDPTVGELYGGQWSGWVIANPDTTAPVITLVGANPQTLVVGSGYVELGATASDDVDGDISGSIVIDASGVNMGVVGSYVVTYNVMDAAGNPAIEVTRTVNVVGGGGGGGGGGGVDVTAPVITLVGANPQILVVGSGYVELGATASDDVDGDISGSIVIDASGVNMGVVGSYVVTYNVADAAGNPAPQVTRTVTVAGPSGTFVDDDSSIFEDDVEWLVAKGITNGCTLDNFCGADPITRGQLAAFVHRALGPHLSVDMGKAIDFSDTDGTTFEADIAWLSAAGITIGCGPEIYCPNKTTTRGQMAAFMERAFGTLIPTPVRLQHGFTDVAGSIFEANIQWLADTRITRGCSLTAFCPGGVVNRYQFAAFLHRAFIAAGLA